MATAKVTMWGLLRWDPTLFNGLRFPDALNRDTVINSILMTCNEFEVMYADPEYMKMQLKYVNEKWKFTFQKWVDAITSEFNPIENYDRMEEWTDESELSGSATSTGNVSESGTVNVGDNTENSVTAYDSDTYHKSDKSDFTSNTTSNTQNTTTGTNSTTNDATAKHVGRVHGNIGVTTSQQMIQASLDLYNWNIYEHIADIFCRELCIMIY